MDRLAPLSSEVVGPGADPGSRPSGGLLPDSVGFDHLLAGCWLVPLTQTLSPMPWSGLRKHASYIVPLTAQTRTLMAAKQWQLPDLRDEWLSAQQNVRGEHPMALNDKDTILPPTSPATG
jgi:hypothetical protein